MGGDSKGNEIDRFLAAWFEVRQFIQAANFNHFHKSGLSATQFMILNLLPAAGERMSIGELARRLNLKPATVAKTVDTLEERQMLTRAKSPQDGRQVLLEITAEGSRLQNAAAGHFRDQITAIFEALPAEDRAGLVRGLEGFAREAEAARGGAEKPSREEGGAVRDQRSFRRSGRP